MSKPNQNLITIHKSKSKEPFLMMSQQEFWDAFKQLKDPKFKTDNARGGLGALALWMYLAQNSDGFNLEFSPQAFMNLSSISRSSVYKSRNALIELGYLIKKSSNGYDFYLKPQKIYFETDNLTFKEAIQLGEEEMKNLYYQLQNEDWDSMSQDMKRFYEFYQEEIEEV